MAIDARAGKARRKPRRAARAGENLGSLVRRGETFTPVLARSGARWYLLSTQLAGGIAGHELADPDAWREGRGPFRSLPDDLMVDELRPIPRSPSAGRSSEAPEMDPVVPRHLPPLPARRALPDE